MKTLPEIAGHYYLLSPYHADKRKLPYNIESDGFISTVEYKGNTAFLNQGYLKLEVLIELIECGFLKEGKVKWPKYQPAYNR